MWENHNFNANVVDSREKGEKSIDFDRIFESFLGYNVNRIYLIAIPE